MSSCDWQSYGRRWTQKHVWLEFCEYVIRLRLLFGLRCRQQHITFRLLIVLVIPALHMTKLLKPVETNAHQPLEDTISERHWMQVKGEFRT